MLLLLLSYKLFTFHLLQNYWAYFNHTWYCTWYNASRVTSQSETWLQIEKVWCNIGWEKENGLGDKQEKVGPSFTEWGGSDVDKDILPCFTSKEDATPHFAVSKGPRLIAQCHQWCWRKLESLKKIHMSKWMTTIPFHTQPLSITGIQLGWASWYTNPWHLRNLLKQEYTCRVCSFKCV